MQQVTLTAAVGAAATMHWSTAMLRRQMLDFRFDNAFLRELPGDPEAGPRVRQVEGALWSRVAADAGRGAAAARVFARDGADARA